MADYPEGALDDCISLGEPMSQFFGGVAAVPATGAGVLEGVGVASIVTGPLEGYLAYQAVQETVEHAWPTLVCEPLYDFTHPNGADPLAPLPFDLPPPPADPPASPFFVDLAPAGPSFDTTSSAFDVSPSVGDSSGGSYDSGYSGGGDYSGGGSSGGDSGGGGGSDGGST